MNDLTRAVAVTGVSELIRSVMNVADSKLAIMLQSWKKCIGTRLSALLMLGSTSGGTTRSTYL